jgi:hypothetical protein
MMGRECPSGALQTVRVTAAQKGRMQWSNKPHLSMYKQRARFAINQVFLNLHEVASWLKRTPTLQRNNKVRTFAMLCDTS